MNLSDICNQYHDRRISEIEKKAELEKKIAYYDVRIQSLEEKRSRHQSKLNDLYRGCVSWTDSAVELGSELAKLAGTESRVTGPFGICSRVRITLHAPGDVYPYMLPFKELEIEPLIGDKTLTFLYVTDEYVENCPKGSSGEVNGMNWVTKPLPDDLNEVLKLFKTVDPG